MSREWKPGDVVTATVNGRPNVRLVAGWSKYDPQLRWCELSPRWADGDDDECWFLPSQVIDARPVVVIDPEDREQVERLAKGLPTMWNLFQPDDPELGDESVRAMQSALRSLIAPPKPEEPKGLGAVVEDAEGRRWVRSPLGGHGAWDLENEADYCDYAEIDAVRVLSQGVNQ